MRDTESDFSKFLGNSPMKVFVRLVLISVLVGFVMAVFNLQPLEIVNSTVQFFLSIWETGFEAFGDFGRYLVAGATLVVPIWLIMRIVSYRRLTRARDRDRTPSPDGD